MSVNGTKRTKRLVVAMSAFDPKRTSRDRGRLFLREWSRFPALTADLNYAESEIQCGVRWQHGLDEIPLLSISWPVPRWGV